VTDVNTDGARNDGESGVNGAVVYLDANNNGRLDPGEAASTTGADGGYTFTDLAAGTYRVRADAPFVVVTSPAGGAAIVTVAGGDRQEADFGLLGVSPRLPLPVPQKI